MDAEESQPVVGPGYPAAQLVSAFVTALTHEDAATRRRGEHRARKWRSVLEGMFSGRLAIGSRAPVVGLPVWVTPEVVKGGFATGSPVAGGDLAEDERELARRVGVPPRRSALFSYFLTDVGLGHLDLLLRDRNYRVAVPEESALLVVAWLVRAGEVRDALDLVKELQPFSDRLRFWPHVVDSPTGDRDIVSRETVHDVRHALASKQPNAAVATMREALEVWAPFGDALLDLCLDSRNAGHVLRDVDEAWRERAAILLAEYRVLAVRHTRCSKHRKPKENLAILLSAVETLVKGEALSPRQLGMVQHAMNAMVQRRSAPGTPQHRALRQRQHRDATLPMHATLAAVVGERLAIARQHGGLADTESWLDSVTTDESKRFDVPMGSLVPASFERILARALEGRVDELIARGVIPSAEVLARLVPHVAAGVRARSCNDPDLGEVLASTYLAFRRRRSLLLLNLEQQVRLEELPWMRAVERFRAADQAVAPAYEALQKLAELAIDGFPATVLPNPMVRELAALGREAREDAPFVEEIATDIFMGTFSTKFAAAAAVAAQVMRGTLYGHYYEIDFAMIEDLPLDPPERGLPSHVSSAFARVCRARAKAPDDRWSPAANGMIIEQAQVLTTHNLASLVGPVGLAARFEGRWETLANRSFDVVMALLGAIDGNPKPLRTVKDAAYAWRQMVFFLSFVDADAQARFVETQRHDLARHTRVVAKRAEYLLLDLGVAVTSRGSASGEERRPFYGWAVGGHWLLKQPPERSGGV